MNAENRNRGFTLVELVVVVVLIALLATFAVRRFDSLLLSRHRSEVRRFANTWELLFNEALLRGNGYRLIVDLDSNTYYARRETELSGTAVRQVDYLKNLRTRSERERRARREAEDLDSVENEYRDEDIRQGQTLDTLFYAYLYADPKGPTRLTRPLEFPRLAEPISLPAGLSFIRAKTFQGEQTQGQLTISFSPRGGSSFAVVYLRSDRGIFTVFMSPSSGEIAIHDREVDYEWLRRKTV